MAHLIMKQRVDRQGRILEKSRFEVRRHPRLTGQNGFEPQRWSVPRHGLAKAEAFPVRGLDCLSEGYHGRLYRGVRRPAHLGPAVRSLLRYIPGARNPRLGVAGRHSPELLSSRHLVRRPALVLTGRIVLMRFLELPARRNRRPSGDGRWPPSVWGTGRRTWHHLPEPARHLTLRHLTLRHLTLRHLTVWPFLSGPGEVGGKRRRGLIHRLSCL